MSMMSLLCLGALGCVSLNIQRTLVLLNLWQTEMNFLLNIWVIRRYQ